LATMSGRSFGNIIVARPATRICQFSRQATCLHVSKRLLCLRSSVGKKSKAKESTIRKNNRDTDATLHDCFSAPAAASEVDKVMVMHWSSL
ncbi:hypothetical protein A2U01_0046887, partial [Trifolium medium]|nr:hypothetical protein [Trifolium medium]